MIEEVRKKCLEKGVAVVVRLERVEQAIHLIQQMLRMEAHQLKVIMAGVVLAHQIMAVEAVVALMQQDQMERQHLAATEVMERHQPFLVRR